MSQLDFKGSSAIDALGSQAFADSDGDGQLEVVDGWEDPIAFQFQQESITQDENGDGVPDPANVVNGVWASSNRVTDFEVNGNDLSDTAQFNTMLQAVRPTRADQIRPFFTSSELVERDGDLLDFDAIE